MTKFLTADNIFNSPLETGIRSVCVLAADDSMKYDLQQLLAFDHLVVHTGDVDDAPPSLHPNVLQRNGELLIRRPLVERGLLLMESKNLVEKLVTSEGFYYTATELATVFVESLTNDYVVKLYSRSVWAVTRYKDFGDHFFAEVFNTAFDRWTNEFQIADVNVRHSTES
jgi:hypothetical protein